MDAILGMELPLIVKFVVSFAIVLILIGAAALLVRKFGGKALIPGAAGRGRQPRLAVVDTAAVDSRRSLVIVRRDNVEHLLLIGGPTDVLVESNISTAPAQPSRASASELRPPAIERTPVAERTPAIERTPAVERVPAVEPEPVKPSAAAPAAAMAPPVEIAPPRLEPSAHVPDLRPELRLEPVLMPEARREPEVREPPIPVFMPASTSAMAVEADEPPAPEIFVEPRQAQVPSTAGAPPSVAAPPVTAVPPLPVAAATDLDEPLARFAQDLNAHRDHMNGQRPSQSSSVKAPPPHVTPPQSPAAAPPRSIAQSLSDEQSLADMAQRLEAALRRPLGANGTRAVPQQQPSPRVSASISVRPSEPLRRANAAPPIPPQPAAARPAPPLAPPLPQQSADEAATYENLQREMASLLGRKPGSS